VPIISVGPFLISFFRIIVPACGGVSEPERKAAIAKRPTSGQERGRWPHVGCIDLHERGVVAKRLWIAGTGVHKAFRAAQREETRRSH
jgi:hypothetical protein